MQRNKRCCIDSCVWIKYAGHLKSATLLRYINENKLIVFADRYLLAEIHDALVSVFHFSFNEANYLIRTIEPYIVIVTPRSIYRLSPDPKDNYLYDICIQYNCKYLITIDKALLLDENAPFIRKTDAWLKKKK
jgi:putative PIN family toxin of toxin-antitoxin system